MTTFNPLRAMLVLALAVVLLPATAAAAAEPPSVSRPMSLRWAPCPEGDPPNVEMECAPLEVPLDWSKPGGRKLTLMVGRLKPDDATPPPARSVLVNFGGPIGNSIELMRLYGHQAFAGLRQRMNIVTWDIRGGPGLPGLSTPNLPCTWHTTRVPAYPRSQQEFDALAASNRAAANECRVRDPELFDHMDSASNARDVEAIRRALGEAQVNFYGASYGGFIAQSYARLYPQRVRTMVLDGTWNHSARDWNRELDGLALANEHSIRRFFNWCADTPACVLHGTNLSQRWRRLVAKADRTPIPAPAVDARYDGRDLQGFGLALAKGGSETWPMLAQAIVDAENGDASGFAPAPPQRPYASVPTPAAVECLDWPHFSDQSELEATVRRLRRLVPDVGATDTIAMNTLLCVGWPAKATNLPEPLPGGLPPLLGAGNWNEYEATSRVLAQVPGSGGVYHDSPGHTLYPGNACARDHIDRYLADRTIPPSGTTCP
ncbi:alpha/beta hydrolase family protein [Flindersiella endophytica]